jgi:adenylate cyclase
VHAVLSARIDRLPEREKQVLQNAAVIGKEFAEPILAAVCELPKAERDDALATLCNAEFIHQQSLYPVAEYAFAHPLTQEVALGSQLHEQRRRVHARVAAAIQADDPERVDEHAALLAHHYEQADAPLEAARFYRRAAEWLGTRDLVGTLRHWQKVRELVRPLPEDEETVDLRMVACAQILVMGGFRLGLSEAAVEELYEEGLELARRSESLAMQVVLGGAYGARLLSLARVREALEIHTETLALADRLGIKPGQAGARIGVGYANEVLGHLEEALRYLREGEELSRGDLEMGREGFGFSYWVFFVGLQAPILAGLGRLDEARRQLERGLRLARESGIPENLGWISGNVADLASVTGELDFAELGNAKAAALEGLRLAEELGSAFSRVIALTAVGEACLLTQEWHEAERMLDAALELARSYQTSLEFEPLALNLRSRAKLGQGDAAAARRDAEDSVGLAQERGQRYAETFAQIALANALIASDAARSRTGAEEALERAETLVKETGARALEPWIYEARSQLARACGDAGAADQALREALRLYQAIGATGHARRLAAELGEA